MLETFAGIVHAERAQSRREETTSDIHDHERGVESSIENRDDDFHLLPPDERVLTLLEEHGGRMWQQDVIAETGYSQGRVSKLLSEMEDEGHVNRYWKRGEKVVAQTKA